MFKLSISSNSFAISFIPRAERCAMHLLANKYGNFYYNKPNKPFFEDETTLAPSVLKNVN